MSKSNPKVTDYRMDVRRVVHKANGYPDPVNTRVRVVRRDTRKKIHTGKTMSFRDALLQIEYDIVDRREHHRIFGKWR